MKPAASAPTAPAGSAVALRVKWRKTVLTRGCFYFSGPNRIGRDNKLGVRATLERRGFGSLRLSFGVALFEGTAHGGKVRLTRKSDHGYQGSVWRTREMIVGTLRGGVLSGAYSYEECNTGGHKRCPGHCRITARLRAAP